MWAASYWAFCGFITRGLVRRPVPPLDAAAAAAAAALHSFVLLSSWLEDGKGLRRVPCRRSARRRRGGLCLPRTCRSLSFGEDSVGGLHFISPSLPPGKGGFGRPSHYLR